MKIFIKLKDRTKLIDAAMIEYRNNSIFIESFGSNRPSIYRIWDIEEFTIVQEIKK